LDERAKNFRNFATKLRNVSRFILELKPEGSVAKLEFSHKDDKWIKEELSKTESTVSAHLEKIDLHLAADAIYDFIWHKLADIYLEKSKSRRSEAQPVLEYVLKQVLVLLHPFMPFLTEEIYQKFKKREDSIILEKWSSG
jgi:valyl-tRNA synthetase